MKAWKRSFDPPPAPLLFPPPPIPFMFRKLSPPPPLLDDAGVSSSMS